MTSRRALFGRLLGLALLVALLPGCVYYNTLYLAKRYYNRSFQDVPYALDKSDLSNTAQFPRTIELSKKALARYPRSKYRDDAYVLWAKSLIGSDDPRQAIRMLEDFETEHPKSSLAADAAFYLGVAQSRSRKSKRRCVPSTAISPSTPSTTWCSTRTTNARGRCCRWTGRARQPNR